MISRKLNTFIALVLLFTFAAAQDPDSYSYPELVWESFETDHFVIHFHQGTKRTAFLVGKIAEDIYPSVTMLYQYEPDGKIHFIVRDTDDYSNGAAYFFDNKIEIWAENLDYVMRGTRNWLRDVVTHEFTHMISIQAMIKTSRSVPYGFLQWFGYEPERRKDVVRGFPNTIVSYPLSSINIPVWFAEGTAQYQAPGAKYDYRDPHREMILRDRVIHNALLTYTEMGVFGKDSHGNESAYNQGFAFVEYITRRFGPEVLGNIAKFNAQIGTLTFNQAIEKSTGITTDSLYAQWKKFLQESYQKKLAQIIPNEVKGAPVETDGFSNLYPIWSPDGSMIAYISNKGNDYFSQNRLIVMDRETGEKTTIASKISSSISWSPDGRYLAYARPTGGIWPGSTYNDLWVYDFKSKQEYFVTLKMRAKNPDWNSDGTKLVFVSETNGLNQLNILEFVPNIDSSRWTNYLIDPETGRINDLNFESPYIRNARVLGNLKQLLAFQDGRQIYHPRWSPDDRRIIFDTATDYGRDIGMYDFSRDTFSILIAGKEELRYPVFHPSGSSIYFASSETGIYNLYRQDLDTNEKILLTNVTGGAMMPDINTRNEIIYACYDSIGYKIYTIRNHVPINPDDAVYDADYPASVPDKNFENTNLPDYQVGSSRQQFTGVHILPRLLIDYGTIKPGLYLYATDVLDKMNLFTGGDVNFDFDYDLFGIFEYRKFGPTLFLEGYNMNANITDTIGIRTGRETEVIDQDINFNLTEFQAGVSFQVPRQLYWRFAYILSLYNAKLNWIDPFYDEPFTFRYRYLTGWALENSMLYDGVRRDKYTDINPSGGRLIFFKYGYEENKFLEDFKTGTSIGVELYKLYKFFRFELDWEEYFKVPLLRNHSLAVRLRAGYIDRPVDDFFHLFAGGLIGMKGYSFFSIGGTKKLIGTVTYRFPIFNNIDWQLFNIYLDKLYFGVFYDYGNAWTEDAIDFSQFKRGIGFQLRLDTFSNYLFPTRIFWEAVYPVDKLYFENVTYNNDWRYYFGILFEFDIRERFKKIFRYF